MEDKKNNELTCNKCGTVHFGISGEEAEDCIDSFNAMYETLTPSEQVRYYGGHATTIESYVKCITCGNDYKDFRIAESDDCPDGVTINPILINETNSE